jgi:cell shape-determining protein MreD
VLLDLALHVGLGLGGLAPDLIAVAVLLTARRSSAVSVAVLALVLGLIDDAMGVGNLGARALGLGFAGLVGTWTRQLVDGEGPLFIVPYLFLGKWLVDAIVTLLRPQAAAGDDIWIELVTAAPITAVWTAVAGTITLVIFRIVAGRDA